MNHCVTNAKSIFGNALEIESPQERFDYLDSACAGDTELRREVETLLQAHGDASQFMVRPLVESETHTNGLCQEEPGTQIGPYRLLEQIGEGGFGIVYAATQTEPIRRSVAIKVIKPGMDSRDVIARFQLERQALAMMQHPGTAKVLDAGTTDRGRPFFVMELVPGVPITEYCEQDKLSTQQRLELIVEVCRAVQHAHQKGIIHRDLKPSNVLVTVLDDHPVVKVIDFGVAKALDQKLSDDTIRTSLGQIVGTPMYMTPEQAELSGLDVDTRSDVYSLGVLLYEVLTGLPPFENSLFRKASFDEMRRIIREKHPVKPSARISAFTNDLSSKVPDQRRVGLQRVMESVRGDLDLIVMKALEKDRERRYESAAALAADIDRARRNEPVQATAPSTLYRMHKFALRNRAAIATVSLVAVSLLVGAGISVWQAAQATYQAGRARQAEQLAQRRLEDVDRQRKIAESNFRQASAETERAQANVRLALAALDQVYMPLAEAELFERPELTDTEKQILENALPFYENLVLQIGDEYESQFVRARALRRIGSIYTKLRTAPATRMKPATEPLRAAIRLLEDLVEKEPSNQQFRWELALARTSYSTFLTWTDSAEATQAWERSIAETKQMAESEPSRQNLVRATLHHRNFGVRLMRFGSFSEAVEACQQGTVFGEKALLLYPDFVWAHVRLGEAITGVGTALWRSGKHEHALPHLSRAIELLRDANERFPASVICKSILAQAATEKAMTLVELDQPDQAIVSFQEASEFYEASIRLVPKSLDHWSQYGSVTLPEMGDCYSSLGRYDDAKRAWRRGVEVSDQFARLSPHDSHPQDAKRRCLTAMIERLWSEGNADEARSFLEMFDPESATDYLTQARVYQKLDEFDLAEQDYRRAENLDPKFHSIYEYRGGLFAELGQWEKAHGDYQQLVTLRSDSHWTYKLRALARFRLGRFEESLNDLQRAVELNPLDGSNLTWLPVRECLDRADFRAGLLELADRTIELAGDRTDVYWATAYVRMYAGQWERAEQEFRRFNEPKSGRLDTVAYHYYAVACCEQKRESAYRKVCTHLCEQYRAGNRDVDIRRAAWICCLAPNAVNVYDDVLEMAQAPFEQNELEPDNRVVWGAALYRAGRGSEAIDVLSEVPAPNVNSRYSPAYAPWFLAMSHHSVGHREQAEETLRLARQLSDSELEAGTSPFRQATLGFFAEEASALIGVED